MLKALQPATHRRKETRNACWVYRLECCLNSWVSLLLLIYDINHISQGIVHFRSNILMPMRFADLVEDMWVLRNGNLA